MKYSTIFGLLSVALPATLKVDSNQTPADLSPMTVEVAIQSPEANGAATEITIYLHDNGDLEYSLRQFLLNVLKKSHESKLQNKNERVAVKREIRSTLTFTTQAGILISQEYGEGNFSIIPLGNGTEFSDEEETEGPVVENVNEKDEKLNENGSDSKLHSNEIWFLIYIAVLITMAAYVVMNLYVQLIKFVMK